MGLVCIILGCIVGLLAKRDIQKICCPYCSCRDCCKIGHGIDAMCSEDKLEPMVCYKRG